MGKSIAFYTQVLGFQLLRHVRLGPEGPQSEVAYVGLGDVLLELFRPHTGSTDTADSTGAGTRPFGLAVDDLQQTLDDLQSKGVEVATPPRDTSTFGGRIAAIRDLNGLVIELKEYRNDSPHNDAWRPGRPDVSRLA